MPRCGAVHDTLDHVALVELQLHIAGHSLFQTVGKGIQCLAQRGEPLAVVHDVGVLLCQLCLEVRTFLVQRDGLQHVDGLVQDGAAGGLVHAAALHAHQTVLHDVQQTNAVCAAQLVQVLHQFHSAHLLAVHSSGNTLFKVDGHIGGNIGCLLGADAQLQEAGLIVLGLVGGALQIQTLVAQVPQVLVLGVIGLTVDLQGDVVRLGAKF